MPMAQVTPRDVKLLAMLGEYGVLDVPLIHGPVFSDISGERCRQILARLAQAGLIRPVRLQVWYAGRSADNRYRGGRVPTLFVLTERGAEIVQQWTGAWPRRACRSDPSPATFFHRLQIVRVRLAFESAARFSGLESPSWIMEQDTRPDAPKKLAPNRRRWLYHEYATEQGTVTCQPDAAVRLAIPHPNSGATQLVGALEVDLSQEGHAQIKKKVPGYEGWLAQPSFPYWPDLKEAAVRVLWITMNDRRLHELAGTLKGSPIADRLRFTSIDHCTETLLSEAVWQDVHGEQRAFLNL